MRKLANLALTTTVALALVTALATPAAAGSSNICKWFPRLCTTGTTTPSAPEIDPSVARSAITILVGGVLMLAGRRRRS